MKTFYYVTIFTSNRENPYKLYVKRRSDHCLAFKHSIFYNKSQRSQCSMATHLYSTFSPMQARSKEKLAP